MKTLTIVVALFSSAPAFAQDETVGIRVREWLASLDGDVKSGGDLLTGTQVDLDSVLGFDDAELAHEIQLFVDVPILGRFYAGYWFADFEGKKTLSQTVTFEDITFSVSTEVKSEVDLDVYYLTWEWGLLSPKLGDLAWASVALQAGVRVISLDASIESGIQSASSDGTAPLPVVGGHVAVQPIPWLRAEIEGVGLTFHYGDVSATYLEISAEVVAQPWQGIFAGVGYKFVKADVEVDASGTDDFELNLDISGVYFTVGYRF